MDSSQRLQAYANRLALTSSSLHMIHKHDFLNQLHSPRYFADVQSPKNILKLFASLSTISCFQFLKVFKKVYLFEKQINKQTKIFHPLVNFADAHNGPDHSQELQPGLPHVWQRPRYLSHHLLSRMQISKSDQQQRGIQSQALWL